MLSLHFVRLRPTIRVLGHEIASDEGNLGFHLTILS